MEHFLKTSANKNGLLINNSRFIEHTIFLLGPGKKVNSVFVYP